MSFTRAAFLLLPAAAVLAVDPLPFDFQAVKYVAIAVVAIAVLAGAAWRGLFAWTNLSAPLWAFVAVRGIELWRAPPAPRALRWWCLLLALTLVHHVAAAAAPRRWWERRLVPLLAGLGGIVAIYAVVQVLSDSPQAHAFFANRNFAGAGLALLLPYALAWPHRARWAFVVLIGIGLVASQSRGGLLAASVGVAWWVAPRLPRFRWALLALPVVVLALGLTLGRSDTVKVRQHWYAAAAAMGAEQPLLGHGAEGFRRGYPPVRPIEEHAISGGRTVHAVHNDYLEAWVAGGALGVAAFLLLLIAVLRAARANRAVAASWLALAAAAMVDLPWRDPSLVALAYAGLPLVTERRLLEGWARPAAAAGLAALLLVTPIAVRHWVADRAFGRYLSREGDIDLVLRWEPAHPEALIERSRPEDLTRLLAQEPHHAGAHYNRTRFLTDDDAVPALRAILAKHDPHHTLTHVRLAQLLAARDQRSLAVTLLEQAIEADPRPVAPYVALARFLREAGRLDRAAYWLDRVPRSRWTPEFAREELEVELGALREGRFSTKRLDYLVRTLDATFVQRRIQTALERGEAVIAANPRPKVPPREGESPDAHIRRVKARIQSWRVKVRERARPDFTEAFLLSESLCRSRPTPPRFRQKARAARGLGDVERAGHFESQALFLEALGALQARDPVTARRKLKEARTAYPDVLKEPSIVVSVRAFVEKSPELISLARELFGDDPVLSEVLGR
ncbi:MAG: O-antigen ligase family protein [Planctomycetota bacterium]